MIMTNLFYNRFRIKYGTPVRVKRGVGRKPWEWIGNVKMVSGDMAAVAWRVIVPGTDGKRPVTLRGLRNWKSLTVCCPAIWKTLQALPENICQPPLGGGGRRREWGRALRRPHSFPTETLPLIRRTSNPGSHSPRKRDEESFVFGWSCRPHESSRPWFGWRRDKRKCCRRP